MAFVDEIRDWARRIELGLLHVQRDTGAAMLNETVRYATVHAVDTGRFRASWYAGENFIDGGSHPALNHLKGKGTPVGPVQLAPMLSRIFISSLGANLWITNNVFYASILEKGSPTMAPRGVLTVPYQRVVLSFGSIVQAAATKAGLSL